MYKKTIKYEDFDGNEREEDFYFHLTDADVVRYRFSEKGGIEKLIEEITKEQDFKRLIEKFEDLIQRSYGRKSHDGRKFEKTEEILEDFMATEAYSQLFMELATDDVAAAEFVNSVFPKSLRDKAAQAQEKFDRDKPTQLPQY